MDFESIDPFFEVIGDGEWNACIGSQGSEENYVDGYMEAALLLASTVIKQNLWRSRDTLVLPILYNARHALELCLKFIIGQLHEAGVLTTARPVNHDILSHWKILADAAIGDAALRKYIDELRPFVISLGRIDVDGQQLRYAETRAGTKSLTNHAVVNLQLILVSLHELRRILEDLKNRALEFIPEWGTKSCTKECSRSDLMTIAELLPPYELWGQSEFEEARRVIMARYGLSGRKFSAAVKIIKENREMRSLIGLETDLIYLNDNLLLVVVGEWCRYAKERYEDRDRAVADTKTMLEGRTVLGEVFAKVAEVTTLDQKADLIALYYIGMEGAFCEYYGPDVERWRVNLNNSGYDHELLHILGKVYFLDDMVHALNIIGRPSLARQIRALGPSIKV